jgi:hypothetical protein
LFTPLKAALEGLFLHLLLGPGVPDRPKPAKLGHFGASAFSR